MDCLFFRHGLAIERQEWSGQEQDRPLTDKGVTRTRESGKGLLNLRINPTHILSSPLARAHETAAILQSLIRPKLKIRICAELNPAAQPRTLFALLDALPPDAVALCIGHEPHLSLAAGILLTGKPCSGLSFKKSRSLPHPHRRVREARGRTTRMVADGSTTACPRMITSRLTSQPNKWRIPGAHRET